MNGNEGIIIQARTGSTRLPAKILLPFCDGKTILDIIIERIKAAQPHRRIIVATTDKDADSVIAEKAKKHGVDCFRGSENDVLQRFIDAADAFGLDRIIRVCSDNPFLRADSFDAMFDAAADADYVAYAFPDGIPTIKSHLGLYAEYARVDALKRAARRSDDKTDHEHVTIHLYSHPDDFKTVKLPLPEILQQRTDIRLTLDTPDDFKLLAELYALAADADISTLLKIIDDNPRYGSIMKENIKRNEK